MEPPIPGESLVHRFNVGSLHPRLNLEAAAPQFAETKHFLWMAPLNAQLHGHWANTAGLIFPVVG
jgi:hypothetical protein